MTAIAAMIAMMMTAAGAGETMTGWARCCRREGVENVTEEEGRNVTEDMEEEKIVMMTTNHHTRVINLPKHTLALHITTTTTTMYHHTHLTTAMEDGLLYPLHTPHLLPPHTHQATHHGGNKTHFSQARSYHR